MFVCVSVCLQKEEEEDGLGERERERDRVTESEGKREGIPGEKRVYECVWSYNTTPHNTNV